LKLITFIKKRSYSDVIPFSIYQYIIKLLLILSQLKAAGFAFGLN